jgi:thymidylate kinase
MDFPANTVSQRVWFKEILANGQIPHKLIYIEASDQFCLSQIQSRRNEQPERAHFDTEEVFKQVTSYFQPPSQKEGFNVEVVSRQDA